VRVSSGAGAHSKNGVTSPTGTRLDPNLFDAAIVPDVTEDGRCASIHDRLEMES